MCDFQQYLSYIKVMIVRTIAKRHHRDYDFLFSLIMIIYFFINLA